MFVLSRAGSGAVPTTSRPGEDATRLEMVLIAAFKDGRITRVWETTWPSWNDLPAFETY